MERKRFDTIAAHTSFTACMDGFVKDIVPGRTGTHGFRNRAHVRQATSQFAQELINLIALQNPGVNKRRIHAAVGGIREWQNTAANHWSE